MEHNTNGTTTMDGIKHRFTNFENNASQMFSSISNLTDAHIELLSEEVNTEKDKGINAIIYTSVGAAALFLATIFCSVALAQFLAEKFESISLSGGFAIVGAVWLIVTPFFLITGLNLLKNLNIVPKATLESLKESIQCLKN